MNVLRCFGVGSNGILFVGLDGIVGMERGKYMDLFEIVCDS